jgi:hypothetical protein
MDFVRETWSLRQQKSGEAKDQNDDSFAFFCHITVPALQRTSDLWLVF